MSFYPYTPWSSEGSPKEETRGEGGEGGGGGGGGWWKNLKKPWKWKSSGGVDKKKQAQPEPLYSAIAPEERREQFGAFPPMMSRLMFRPERRNSEPLANPSLNKDPAATEDSADEFELPHYEGQKRPRLDNVFPMHDTPAASKSGVGLLAGSNPADRPRIGGGAVGRSSSFNEAREGWRKRREEEEREEVDGGGGHVRGASIDSSGSEDRTLERRKRRMGVVRKLPQLPQRRLDWNDVQSLPEIGHHREIGHHHRRHRRPTPAPAASPFDRRGFGESAHHHAQQPLSPPQGARGHNFSYLPWGSPHETLPTVSEESDSGDIKGFDDFKLY